MAIEIINDKEKWDNFVDKSPYGLLFHEWDFLKTIEKHSDFKAHTYGIYKGDNLISIFPFFYYKKMGLKMIFSPPPKTLVPHLGFIVNNEFDNFRQSKKESYLKSIFIEINNEIKKHSPSYVNISTVPNFLDIRQFKWNGYSAEPRYSYVVKLNKSITDIWQSFRKEARNSINYGKKTGFEFQTGKDISIFYKMLKDRYEEQNLKNPILSKGYIEDLFNYFSDNLKVYYLYNNNREVISFGVTLEYKDRFLFWMGSTKAEKNSNEYLLWKLIQFAKSKDFTKFDLVGANTENICNFKSKFNPKLELYFSLEKKTFISNIIKNTYKKYF